MAKKFVTNGVLQHRTIHYPFRIENISMTGTVVKLEKEVCDPIVPGEQCVLMFYKSPGHEYFTVSAQAVHYSFTLVALQFISLDKDSEQTLGHIIEKVECEKTGRVFSYLGFHHLK